MAGLPVNKLLKKKIVKVVNKSDISPRIIEGLKSLILNAGGYHGTVRAIAAKGHAAKSKE